MTYTFRVYYMKPDFFRDGICGVAHADPADLDKTHVFLINRTVEADTPDDAREEAYRVQQGEVWSADGEARPLIQQKGLHHTSMSVGDVLVDDSGDVYEVQSFGFGKLGPVKGVSDG
jgi:hypothetical protein